MGNTYSLQKEETEEAEFRRLIQDVERGQLEPTSQTPGQVNIEVVQPRSTVNLAEYEDIPVDMETLTMELPTVQSTGLDLQLKESEVLSTNSDSKPEAPGCISTAQETPSVSGTNSWKLPCNEFPMRVFRKTEFVRFRIQKDWDDEVLFRELAFSYKKLRKSWRKWFSLRSARSILSVAGDHTWAFPKRLESMTDPERINIPLQYLLHHPEARKGQYGYLKKFTKSPDMGIEFMEDWQLSRIAIAVLIPALASIVFGVLYSTLYGDVSGAFTIAGYMTSTYSVCLVLLGVLEYAED